MAQSAGDDNAESSDRPPLTDALWNDVRIEPVEIALPAGVGYTLRAYRLSSELTTPELDHEDHLARDEFEAAAAAVAASRRRPADTEDEDAEDGQDVLSGAEEADFEGEELTALAEEEEEEAEEAAPEEVPVFLSRRGRLYLFHSPEKLVEFVRSGAEHDLAQLDTWQELVGRVQAGDINPHGEDRYELDLVVDTLRGGPDAWDGPLVIRAGEIARDVGYALRLQPVITALAPGSPLDVLDEGLRAVEAGGFGALLARRRLRKVGGQGAALAWRTIIGKISAAVDWRD